MEKHINELLSHWNKTGEVKQIKNNVWTVGEDYILKANSKRDWLFGNMEMLKSLKGCGIPVADLIPTVDGCEFIEYNGTYYLMMSKLKGSHITDIYQGDHTTLAYETGKILARLHQAFLSCEPKLELWDSNLIEEMKGWVGDRLGENQYRYCSEDDYKDSVNELQECYPDLPRQLIHRDIHYGNLLFEQGVFSGYIDFDLTQKNARIFDVGYFLMGLLIDHEKKEADVSIWYEFVSWFIRGYEESNPLTELEKNSICCLMKNIELLFVAFFLEHKDEVAAENSAELFYFVMKNDNDIRTAIYKYSM